MNITSLANTATTNRTSLIQLLTNTTSTSCSSCSTKETSAQRTTSPQPPSQPPSFSGGFDPKAMFEALTKDVDADADGAVSVEEMNASDIAKMTQQDFTSVDSDGDGLLSETEMSALLPSEEDMAAMVSQFMGGSERSSRAATSVDSLLDLLKADDDSSEENKDTTTKADTTRTYQESLFNGLKDTTGQTPQVTAQDAARRIADLLSVVGLQAA